MVASTEIEKKAEEAGFGITRRCVFLFLFLSLFFCFFSCFFFYYYYSVKIKIGITHLRKRSNGPLENEPTDFSYRKIDIWIM